MVKGFSTAKKSQNNSTKTSSSLEASDYEQIQEQWSEHFENLDDPRGKQGVLHPFTSIVMISILATQPAVAGKRHAMARLGRIRPAAEPRDGKISKFTE